MVKKKAKKKVAKKKATKKKVAKKKVVAKKTKKKAAKKVVKKAKKVVSKKATTSKKKTKAKSASGASSKKKVVKKSVAKKAVSAVKSVLKKVVPKKTKAKSPVVEKETAVRAKTKKKAEITPEEMMEEMADDLGGFEEEVVLTDAEGRRYCKVGDCDQIGRVDGYCRYHYLLHWKRIQVRKKIISEGKLEKYIEELTAKYPIKYIDMLRKDLKSEKDFMSAIRELEIDESQSGNDDDVEETQNLINEMRGTSFDDGTIRSDDDY